jgi:peptidoglycan hydrolase-like protein with peptidoglycan-binding domain
MKVWKSLFALAVIAALAAGPTLAQTPGGTSGTPGATGTTGSTDTGKGATDTGTSDMKSDVKHKMGKMTRGGHHEEVKAAQQALKDKGGDPGPIDGRMGPKTKAALKDFQKAQGLKETGRLDRETRAKLGIEGKTSATESTSTSPAASPATSDKSDKSDTTTSTAPSNTQNMGSDKDKETMPSGEAKPKIQQK